MIGTQQQECVLLDLRVVVSNAGQWLEMSHKHHHEHVYIQDDLHLNAWKVNKPETHQDKGHSPPNVNKDVRPLPSVVLFHRCPKEIVRLIFFLEKLSLIDPNEVHQLVLKPTEEDEA